MKKSLVIIAVLAAFCAAMPFAGLFSAIKNRPDEFIPADFDTPEKIAKEAKSYFENGGLKKIRAANLRKIAITEFNVEIATSEFTQVVGGANLVSITQAATGLGKKVFEFDENFKKALPRILYDEMAKNFADQGFEVTPLDAVKDSEAFQKFKAEDEIDTKKNYSGSATGSSKSQRIQVYPVEGLLDFKDGAFSATKNMKAEAELLNNLAMDISLRVHLRVGIHKKGNPVLGQGSSITVMASPKSAEGREGKMVYYFEYYGSISCKKSLLWKEDVVDDAEFKAYKGKVMTINSEKYQNALMKMFPAYCKMSISLIE